MTTLGNSRGVRVINMARAGWYLLATQGPKAATQQAIRWLSGERGYWKRATMPPTAAPAPASTSDWSLRGSHLPDATPFAGVSIVIPILNALDYARECVESLYRAAGSVPFEVIAIDNGSQPEVLAWLRAQCQQKDRFYFL